MTTSTPASAPDKLRALHHQLETAFAELVSSEQWARMLTAAARFHSYSPANVLLILRQRPDATRVAGYRTWRELGRQVRRGEHGIAILAPCTYLRPAADEHEPDDEPRRVLRGFKIAHIFDIAQTDGEPVPDVRPALLDGDAPAGLWDTLAAQVAAAGFQLRRGDCHGANGRTNYTTRTVTVRDDVSDAQAVRTLAHELAHVQLHDGTAHALGCRGLVEVEAESVAYIVATAAGMTPDPYSLPYVAQWSAGNVKAVKATAERVIGCAHGILAEIEASEAETPSAVAS